MAKMINTVILLLKQTYETHHHTTRDEGDAHSLDYPERGNLRKCCRLRRNQLVEVKAPTDDASYPYKDEESEEFFILQLFFKSLKNAVRSGEGYSKRPLSCPYVTLSVLILTHFSRTVQTWLFCTVLQKHYFTTVSVSSRPAIECCILYPTC